VDLAAGPGAYLLDVLAESPRPEVRVLLRDVDPAALAIAAATARERGLGQVETALGDALDPRSLAEIRRRPDVAVELGLYGMFGDERIAPHFRDLAEQLGPAVLVCNVQNQNPEIDHIANVWPSRDGGRCEWRLRPLELILGWAEAGGFALERVRRDSNGIYSVLTLRRV
jgi:Putative methyltransferase